MHVYKALRRPPNTLAGEHLVARLQLFPRLSIPDKTFAITWVDNNSGSWEKFRDGAKLLPEIREPDCTVNSSAVVSTARRLAAQTADVGDDASLYQPEYTDVGTPDLNKEPFVDSSSPTIQLSSGSTVPSDKGKGRDLDYEPSLGSDGSHASFDSS